jgi:hypothetical protein
MTDVAAESENLGISSVSIGTTNGRPRQMIREVVGGCRGEE